MGEICSYTVRLVIQSFQKLSWSNYSLKEFMKQSKVAKRCFFTEHNSWSKQKYNNDYFFLKFMIKNQKLVSAGTLNLSDTN